MCIYEKEKYGHKKIWIWLFYFFITGVLATPLAFNHAFVNEYTRPKQYYFFFALSALCIFIALFHVKNKQHLTIHWAIPDVFLLAFYVYCFILVFPGNGMDNPINNIEFLKLTGLVIFYFIIKHFFSLSRQSIHEHLFFLFILMIIGIIEMAIGIPQYLEENNALQLHGTFDNTGPYTNYLCTIYPLALGYLMLNTKKAKPLLILSIIFICGIFIIIPLSKARTAWIAILFSSLFIIYYRYANKIKSLINNRLRKAIVLLIALCLTVPGSYILFNMKKDSALGRLFVWKTTTRMIADKPVLGHGYNAYYPAKNKYQANYFASGAGTEKEKDVAGNIRFAFNDYLQITAGIGIIGLTLFLLFVGTSIYPIKKHEQENALPIMYKGSIIAIFIIALFSYPLQRLSTQLNLCFFLAAANALNSKTITSFQLNHVFKRIAFAGMAIILLLFINMQWVKYKAHLEWKKVALAAQSGKRDAVFDDYAKLYPALQHNPFFLFNYGAELSVAGHYKKGLNILNKAKPLIYDSDVFIYLGNCYRGLQQYKQAEDAYMEAIHLKPYLFIPRYQLVHLYVHTGNNNKAVKMAKETIALKPKVNTTMIKRIKQEMYEFLENFQTSK